MRRLTLAVFVTAALACAEERPVIDRTQPNGVAKELFQGEWYYQQTVVEIPGTWSHTFVGETNWWGMERVRWDIQEDWLYARRSFERIKNAEGHGNTASDPNPDGKPYLGAILAAYRIESHFDLKRAYNPSTGEEYNVLEENTFDNPWYDRQYMRVDWSKNHATEFMFLVDDVATDPVAYYIQDPTDPDYPVFDAGEFDGDGNMVRQPYIDVTNTVMTQPGMTYFPELGESYPTCWLFSRATSDCTTEPVKIRNSFLRLDPGREYVAAPFKGTVTDYFGLFTQDRLVYDPEREVNERYRERYAQLHNLWLDWLDDNGDLIADPADRGGVRPMVYYVHNWPETLDGTLRKTEVEWDAIFKRAVGAAMGMNGSYDGRVFIACHWPLRADDDPTLCVPSQYLNEDGSIDPAFNPRLGDVRYNWIAFVDRYYDGFALLGLGPSNTDPLTGQVISAGAYLYIYNDIVTQNTTDMIRLLNGQILGTDYIDGVDLTDWVRSQENVLGYKSVDRTSIQRMAEAHDMDWARGIAQIGDPSRLSEFNGRPMHQVMRELGPIAYDSGLFNGTMDDSEGRLAQLKDTYIEDLLLNPEIKVAAGIMPGSSLGSFTDEMLRNASVARVGPVKVMTAMNEMKEYWANVRNVDLMDTADDGYMGLARQFQDASEEEIFDFVRDDIWHAVLAHELGHSFNLHHNFGGTEDVLNYKDEYWTIRDDGNVAPRWQDPITDAEIDQRIYSYAYSSIMDYSRLTLDAFGPGKYDEAAVLLGYANRVELYQNTGSISIPDWGLFHDWSTSDGQIITFYFPQPEAFHYTEWFRRMGHAIHEPSNRILVPARSCEAGADAGCIDWNTGIYTDLDAGIQSPRVPYIFCSPYQSDIGNGCFTRDYGADEFERVQHHIRMAQTWYISRAFPRYAVGANDPMEYVGRTYPRMYRRMKGYNDYYALIVGLLKSFGFPDSGINGFLTDELTGWASYTIAEHDLFNFLLSTVTTPDVNGFDPITDPAGENYLAVSPFSFTSARTALGSGRYFTTTWWDANGGDTCGMYWWECMHHYGFYLDKVMALEALTDANTYFVARDTAEDVREWRISFYDNFGPQIDRFIGGLMAQDYSDVAPYYQSFDAIQHPDYALGDLPSAGQPIDPGAGFTVQLYAAVLGMARLQNNFDKNFLDSSRMWLAGSGFAANSDFGFIEFIDPQTGKGYRAIDFPAGNGVAQRMIDRANRILARSHYCAGACVGGLTEEDRTRADAELVRYRQVLDVMVDLTGYYETYTQGYGNPYNPGEIGP